MIYEEIVTYDVAKLAKEKGFDWMPSMYFHSGVESDLRVVGVNGANPNKIPHSPHISCPTQTQLQRWLREEKGVTICVDIFDDGWFFDISTFYKQDTGVYEVDIPYKSSNVSPVYDTYELALEDALKYALENLV